MESISLKKINLRKSGDSSEIPVKNLHCKMLWKAPVDLDLSAYYQGKKASDFKQEESTGFFSSIKKMFGSTVSNLEGTDGQVYYGSKGSRNRYPYIQLDQDAGVGDTGGDNEENLFFKDLSVHDYILIVANIYGKSNASFASYDGSVIISVDDKEYTVPLTSETKGSYCVVAYIDNTSGTPKLVNVNKTMNSSPKIEDIVKKK